MTTNTNNITGSNASVIAGLQKSAAAANSQVASNNALAAGANSGSAGLASNLNMFLTLLTTQLSHQDPMNPTDSSQFTNQLVQYSQVEQAINTNTNLSKLITLQSSNQQATAIGYIGQTVEMSGSTLPLQNSAAAFNYTLPSTAAHAVFQIQDASGNTVAQLTGPTTAGTHYLSWNGTNTSGTQLTDGTYTIVPKVSDASGNTITPTTNTYGMVTGVSSDATNGTQLNVGSVSDSLSGITAIVDLTQLNNNIKNGV
jgi:flagellar basal-body rod modification protein FlgD